MHVRTLTEHFEVVSLTDWLSRAAHRQPLPPLACSITFDDGWRDNHEFAYPVLQRAGVTATLFLVSDLIGTTKRLWTTRLAYLLLFLHDNFSERQCAQFPWLQALCPRLGRREPIDADAIDDAIERAKRRYSDKAIEAKLAECEAIADCPDGADSPAMLDWDQIREMLATGSIDIGSHTRSHRRMSDTVSESVMQDEIAMSRRVLEEKTGVPVDVFCYPNGDATQAAADLVKSHYLGACSTMKGWHSAAADPHMIRRVPIHEDVANDRAAFLTRISAWL